MLNLIEKIIDIALSPLINLFDFPIVPLELKAVINFVLDYIEIGILLLDFFCPMSLIRPAIDIFLTVYIIEHTYHIILWVLKKIPMLGIE